MQLILDAETTIDVESNMSAINQESLDEKFANNLIEHFTKDHISNTDNDNIEEHNDLLSDSKHEEEKKETDNEDGNIETSKPITSNNIVNEVIGDSKLNDSSLENDDILSENVAENIEKEITENSDMNIEKKYELESHNDTLVEENTCLTETSSTFDKEIIELESDMSESTNVSKESCSDINILEEKPNESVIEDEKVDDSEDNSKTEATNDCEVIESLEKSNDEQNSCNVEIDKPSTEELEKSVSPSTVSSMDCDTKLEENTADEEVTKSKDTVISENVEEKQAESDCDNQIIVNQSAADVNNKENDVKEANEEEEQVPISESITTKDVTEKREEEIIDKIADEAEVDITMESTSKIEVKKIEEKKKSSLMSKLSNTLDILSDDEEEQPEILQKSDKPSSDDKQSVGIEDEDDDIMLIDEDTNSNTVSGNSNVKKTLLEQVDDSKASNVENANKAADDVDTKNEAATEKIIDKVEKSEVDVKAIDCNGKVNLKPLLPSNFLKTCKKNLADMTREDLEEFCILKIVEAVVDRSNLGEIKIQLKNLTQAIEEHKKKAMMLNKQNRDLQVILKSVQEEQKKSSGFPITPLKITRSVGMQVLMTDKPNAKRKNLQVINPTNTSNYSTTLADKSTRSNNNHKTQKGNSNNQQIPVPRLVPAANTSKANAPLQTNVASSIKSQLPNTLPNGMKNSSTTQKPEKRPRLQSVTVDLTDDEPPSKVTSRSSPAPPVRLVPPQNLMAPQRPSLVSNINSPRKVYIPISGPQAQTVRPGQTIMLKSVPPNPGLRPRSPAMNNLAKMSANARMNRVQRHPAPLPDALKQYQPPNWKALPPAPDLKLSKVENGIVISWKIDGYQEDSYEEIASYQLYAYQETTSPSTALWKKIGDVKALPLPMACTLTQFIAGYKYYFAVRAVDVKSRFGPFSLPGSILLLNKI